MTRDVRLTHMALLIVAMMTLGPPAGADDGWLTLEDIFGSDRFHDSSPASIQWLPDSSGFLYRDTRNGTTGLYRFDVATGRERRVVQWGRALAELKQQRPGFQTPAMDDVNTHQGKGSVPVVSPDGRYYLSVAAGDLLAMDLATGKGRFLTNDPSVERFAAFSPDGTRVAFARDGDLHWVDVNTGAERRLTDRGDGTAVLNGVTDWVYEEELGVERSFWWSPDGSRILFVQYDTSKIPPFPITDDMEMVPSVEWQRYPKAGGVNSSVRLGVVQSEGGPIRWIPTGVADGYIVRAGWLPDGSAVWFQILNRDQTRLELRRAILGEGVSRVLVADESPDWVNVRDDLFFVGGGGFVWSSERDGWRHLYLHGPDGRLIRRLTRGEWQVEKAYGLDGSGQRVIFRANAEDHRERHIYSVPLAGGDPVLLVPAAGTHSAFPSPDGRWFVDRFSNVTTPPRLDLYTSVGAKAATVDDGAIPALSGVAFQPPEFDSIAADSGDTLYTWMFRPPDFDPTKKYPVLVYVYGGPGNQMVVNRWGSTRFLFMQYLARQGLVVFCLDNRGSWGRGHAFEAWIHRRLGEVELADQLAGVRYLKSQPWVDGERIGIYGGSYGGYMTLTAMNRASDSFEVGVAYAPVSDWRLYDSIYTERYMDTPADNPEGYRNSSPVHFAEGLAGSLLICHGTMDNNVHLQNTIQMAEQYVTAGKLFDLMIYPRVRHGIRVSGSRLHFHRLKADFLVRRLVHGTF